MPSNHERQLQFVETPDREPREFRDVVDCRIIYGTSIRYFDHGDYRFRTVERDDGTYAVVREVPL